MEGRVPILCGEGRVERGRVPILCRRKKDGGKERCPFYADKEGSKGKGEELEGSKGAHSTPRRKGGRKKGTPFICG